MQATQALAASANDAKLAPLMAHIEQAWQALATQLASPGAKAQDSFRDHTALIARQLGLLNQVPGFACATPGGAFYAWPDVTEACAMIP